MTLHPARWRSATVAVALMLVACSDDDRVSRSAHANGSAAPLTVAVAKTPVVRRVATLGCLGLAWGIGTAFSVSADEFVTSAHVVRGTSTIRLIEPGGDNELGEPARIIAIDLRADLAVLKVERPIGMAAATSALAQGALADTLVVRESAIERLAGRVSSVIRANVQEPVDDTRYIRDAAVVNVAIVGGDSGAPVLDEAGRVAGVMFADSRVTEAKSYAVNGSELARFLADRPAPSDAALTRCG